MNSTPPTPSAPPIIAEQISQRAAVLGLAIPVILSLAAMASWPELYGRPGEIIMSTIRLVRTLGVELLLAATLGLWLWRQGWRPHRTATHPFGKRDVIRSIGLWISALLFYWVWAIICLKVAPDFTAFASHTRVVGHPSFAVIVPLSITNGIFEEFLWLGLGITALRKYGVVVAGASSVCLRTLMHMYQGPLAIVAILPMGIVFTVYYLRTQRLWPVVIAHCLQDILSLGLLAVGVSGIAR